MRLEILQNLFQDSSGLVKVTEAGQPVGLILDESQNKVEGSQLIANGEFDVDASGWLDSLGNSVYEVDNGILYLSSGELTQNISVTNGKVYRLTGNIFSPIGGKSVTFGSASASEERSTIGIPRESRKVFIAIGQSNIDGFSVSLGDPEVPTEYFGTQPYCKFWQPQSLNSSSGSWTTLNTFLKHTVTRYDSAVYNLHRYSPISVPNYDLLLPLMKDIAEFETGPGRPEEPVYLIKNTHPSTFMVSGLDAPWNNLSWTDQSGPVANVQGSGLYFTLINDVSAAIEALRSTGQEESDIEIAGIFVMQGESEAGSTYPAQSNYPNPEDIPGAWGQYFRLFYSNLQRDLKAILYGEGSSADDLPVYLARTHYFLNTGANYDYTDIVREQQESVASDPTLNVTLVDIDEIDHFGDANKVHFDGSGLTSVADRFYSEYFADWNVKRDSFWESQSVLLDQYIVPDSSSLYISLHSPETDPDAAVADLFASGEEGAWYDPSDLDTLFEDYLGTIPVTGAGQPVGLMLDKSKGLVLGEELLTNGSFDTDVSGWGNLAFWTNGSITWNAGQAEVTVSGYQGVAQAFATSALNKWYKISFDVITPGNVGRVYVGNAANVGGAASLNVAYLEAGSHEFIFQSTYDNLAVGLSRHTANGTVTYDNISIRELPGKHAFESGSTRRPTLQASGDLYYLQFDGIDDRIGGIFSSAIPQPMTTIIGYGFDDYTTNPIDYIYDQKSYLAENRIFLYDDNGALKYAAGAAPVSAGSSTEDNTIGLFQYNTTDSLSRINGIQTTGPTNVGTFSCNSINLGCSYAFSGHLRGKVFGFVLVNKVLTEQEITDVEIYLATKSGVSGIAPPLYPNTFDNISLREVAGFHAKQPTSTARPILRETNGYYYLEFDGVDDRLLIELPANLVGAAVISDVFGTASYGVNIPSGVFALGTNSTTVNYSFNKNFLGVLARNKGLNSEQIDTAFEYFREGGASAIGASAYGDVTDFGNYWRSAAWITEFPLIDTTSATSFYAAWYQCTNLKTFPLLDTPNLTNLRSAFFSCTNLSSFPLIDTSQVTNIGYTWMNCGSLSSFPLIDTGSVTNMEYAWQNCTSLSSFPLIDTSQVTRMINAWYNCDGLSSFPQIDTTQVTTMQYAWYDCNNLESFPAIDPINCFDFQGTWARNFKLKSFPYIETSAATNLRDTWSSCYVLSSFPQINTSNVTNFNASWGFNYALSSFPQIDCRSATTLFRTWDYCTSLENFPSGVFDNTSGTVDFSNTLTNTKLNTQSIDNVLLSINNANTVSGIINLNSTNMQSPGVGGTYAKHRLESRGWTVNTKPVSDDVIVSSIFYTGQYGTWYDVNDLDTLFENTAGTIPVTGVGQPVGLMLDKSQGLVLGEELFPEDALDNSGYWSFDPNVWTVSGGALIAASIGSGYISFTFPLSAYPGNGAWYKIEFDYSGPPASVWGPYPGVSYTKLSTLGSGSGHYSFIYRKDLNTSPHNAISFLNGSTSGEAVITNLTLKPFPGNHAYQNTSTARPILQGSAGDYHLDYDQVDDRLLVDVSGFNGTAYIPTEEGSVAYGVAIPSGTYALGTNTTGVTYSFAKELVGGIITDTPMLAPEVGALDQFFAARGAGPYGASAYGGNTSLYQYWRNADWITEFPLIDTSQVATFRDSWSYCYNLRSFPQVNSSAVTSLWSSWAKCHSLSSFPLIDTSQVTDFMEAWGQCYNLSSFPLIDTSKGTRFQQAWWTCSSLTSFPAINTSAGTNFTQTWQGCTNLTDFPLIDTSQALAIDRTWYNCYNLTSFPAINTSAATHFNQAWFNCTGLTDFPLVDTGQATSLFQTWYNCNSLTDFPLIDTGQVTALNSTWAKCYSLTSFPLIDTSQVTDMRYSWQECRTLSSFPLIDTSQVPDLYYTWNGCKALTSFPEINTSAVTRFQRTWFDCDGLSSFPQIDCRSATNLIATWYGCNNLEYFPAGVFDNTSGTTNFIDTFAFTKLNSQSVDNVIISINNANTSGGTLGLNTGSIQAPTASGLLAADYLYDRGWTLSLVGGYTPLNTRVSGIASSDYGLWVDAFDTDYIYEDSAGTIQVTGLESPVGIIFNRAGFDISAYQETSTARPTLTAKHNELLYSQDFDVTSVWENGQVSGLILTPSAITAPDGTNTATKIEYAIGTGNGYEHRLTQYGPWNQNSTYQDSTRSTFSVYAKADTGNYFALQAGAFSPTVIFDLSGLTASVDPSSHYLLHKVTIEDVGDGWRRCSITTSAHRYPGTLEYFYAIANATISLASTNGSTTYWNFGPVGLSVYIWGAQFEHTYELNEYQYVYDASTYSERTKPAYFIRNDRVDDSIKINSSGIEGQAIIATKDSVLTYDVSIPSGVFTLFRNTTRAFYNLHGLFLKQGEFTEEEKITIYGYFKKNTSAPLGENSFNNRFSPYSLWYQANWIKGFSDEVLPMIRSARALDQTFMGCSRLTSFPEFELAEEVGILRSTWNGCTNLSSFPYFETSALNNDLILDNTWAGCQSLSSFPLIDTSRLRLFYTWYNCNSLTSFPLIETGHLTSMAGTWQYCTSLSSFPAIDTKNVTSFGASGGSSSQRGVWQDCNGLITFPYIETSAAVSMGKTWTNCYSLTSFPLLNTSNVRDLWSTWYSNRKLQSFPAINTSAVEVFQSTWYDCTSLTSFPAIDCRSAHNLASTWSNCLSLENFPAGVFDNTSGTVNFSNTFTNTKLNTQSVDNVIVSINNANTSSGTLTLNSTNMQPPSYWGVAASGALTDRGWTVNTKTPTAEAQLDSTIAPMFFSGDVGAWYDPSDFDTMFEAPNSNTFPVTGAGQPVGLILDKSKGLQLSNELIGDTWSFQGSGWSQVGDTLVSVSGSNFGVYQSVVEIGKAYSISFEVFDYESGSVRPRLGNQAEPISAPYITANGVYTATCISKGAGGIYFLGNNDFVGKIRNISVRELPGNHAYQQTSTARPLLAVDASGKYFLDGDGVDDFLQATMPEVIGKKIVADPYGIVEYGVNIPSGTHLLLRNNASYPPTYSRDVYGELISTNPFDTAISSTVIQYLADKGGGPSGVNAFSGITSFYDRWHRAAWMTEFPVIDSSQVDNVMYAWRSCTSLSSFPLIDTSNVIRMDHAWGNCYSLSSFPLLDTTKVTNMSNSWVGCTSLTSFPLLNTSAVTSMNSAWASCLSLSSFPLIDTSQVTTMQYAWNNCNSLSSFPLIDTSKVVTMYQTWGSCTNLRSFPAINTSAVTNMAYTWQYNYVLSSFPLIDTSQVTNMRATWKYCYALSSFPLIDTSKVTDLGEAWTRCQNLTSFPAINTSSATTLANAWLQCYALTSFPWIDTSQVTNMVQAWGTCTSLSSFPLIDTSKATDITSTWYGCAFSSFPELNFSSVTALDYAWATCSNLEVFPSGMFDNTQATNFNSTFQYTKLNTQSIDNVLLSINNANTSDGTISLTTANIQTPGVGGTYAKHQLENRGWTVNTKAVTNDVVVSSVFFEGESAWYDVNDLGMLYTNTGNTPTTQVTGAGQAVAFMADKSLGGMSALGPNLVSATFPFTVSGNTGLGAIQSDSEWVILTYDVTINPGDRLRLLTRNYTDTTYVPPFAYLTSTGTYQFIVKTYNGGLFLRMAADPGGGVINSMTFREIPGTHAYQETSTARPVLQGSAGDYYLDFDGVDDRLLVDSPGFTGTAYIADELGSAAYGIAIPSGTYTIGTNTSSQAFSFAKDIVGEVLLDRPLLNPELTALQTYFDDLGAGPYGASAYGGLTSLYQYWRNADWITEFPLIDTSQVTSVYETWSYCRSLSSFPVIDTSQVTQMLGAWNECNNLSSFPLIDTSKVTNMSSAWRLCNSLTGMPALNTSAVVTLQAAWQNCSNLVTMPLIDTSQVTSLQYTWLSCTSLSSFPAINTSAVTNFFAAWGHNYGLSSFPWIDTGSATSLWQSWYSCYNLTSFPAINTSNVTNMRQAWYNCVNLSSFPWIDTSQVVSLSFTWGSLPNLSSFPAINTSAVTDMTNAWYNCRKLESFPWMDTSQVTSLYQTWSNTFVLSSFPQIDTSQVTSFRETWYNSQSLSSFPSINTSAGTNFYRTWRGCYSLSSFPTIDVGSTTSLQETWRDCTNITNFSLINGMSQVTDLNQTWYNCQKLSSFPLIDTSQVTNMSYTWYNCTSLASFPAIDTSQVTNMGDTWDNCTSLSSFPYINTSAATNLTRTWYNCTSLEHFPAGVFDNTSGTTDFSLTLANTKLNTQSVDNVIVSINNANTSNGTLTLNSTNIQPPSYWGIVASGLLADRGWTVSTRTPTTEALTDSTIASLFFSGDEGAWYDPSDFDTMYQDSIGLIPVTGTGEPVGLILDKSKGLQLGNELVDQANTVSAWIAGDDLVELDGNEIKITGVSGLPGPYMNLNAAENALTTSLTAGKYYKMSFDVRTNGEIVRLVRATSQTVNLDVNRSNTTIETITHYFRSDGQELFRVDVAAGEIAWISNISVRELPGNHAYQNTSTARPTLEVDDITGKYYLDFDGVDDGLSMTFASPLAQPNSIGVGFKYDVFNSKQYDFVYDSPAPTAVGTPRHVLTDNNGQMLIYAGNNIFNIKAASTSDTIYFNHYNGLSSTSRVDGVVEVSGQDVGSLDWNGVVLGADYTGTGRGLNGRIYSFVSINRTLNATEIDTVESYLASKSGVTL